MPGPSYNDLDIHDRNRLDMLIIYATHGAFHDFQSVLIGHIPNKTLLHLADGIIKPF